MDDDSLWSLSSEQLGALNKALEAFLENSQEEPDWDRVRLGMDDDSVWSLSPEQLDALNKALETFLENSQEEPDWDRVRIGMDDDSVWSLSPGQMAAVSRAAKVFKATDPSENDWANLEFVRGNIGVGPDACWEDSTGDRQYAFRVIVNEESIDVERMWPENRRGDAEQIEGFIDFPQPGLASSEFRRLALPIYEWSVDQKESNPKGCRHWVWVVDETSPFSKEAWQDAYTSITLNFSTCTEGWGASRCPEDSRGPSAERRLNR
jgi:hypothetical protein